MFIASLTVTFVNSGVLESGCFRTSLCLKSWVLRLPVREATRTNKSIFQFELGES